MREISNFFWVRCELQDPNPTKHIVGEVFIKHIQTVFGFEWCSYSGNA